MSKRQSATLLTCLLSCFLILFGALSLSAYDPVSLAISRTGEVVFLDPTAGLFKISRGKPQGLVKGFGAHQGIDFASDGDSFYVTLSLRRQANEPFSRMIRWDGAGKQTGEWRYVRTGALLTGVAIDSARQVIYCSDNRLAEIYEVDMRNKTRGFSSLLRVPDAGALGAMVFDAKRKRLIVADVQKGRILAVTLADKQVKVLLDSGTIIQPLALALDPASDRLYIADAARRRVWVGNAAGTKLTVTKFSDQSFREPVGLALMRSGATFTVWVADRGSRTLLQLDADGKKVSSVKL